jgi:hypothetical protein
MGVARCQPIVDEDRGHPFQSERRPVSVGSDRAHGKLRLAGSADLVDEQNVQRQGQCVGHCRSHWHTSPGPTQDDGLVLGPVMGQRSCQQLARMSTIANM